GLFDTWLVPSPFDRSGAGAGIGRGQCLPELGQAEPGGLGVFHAGEGTGDRRATPLGEGSELEWGFGPSQAGAGPRLARAALHGGHLPATGAAIAPPGGPP